MADMKKKFDDLIIMRMYLHCYVSCRAVGRSENPGVPVLFGGNNLSPLVEIGLTDLPKSRRVGGGGGYGTPAPPKRQDEMVVICIIFQIEGSPGIQISILFDDLFL